MKTFYNLHPVFSLQKKSTQLAQCLAMMAIIAWPSSRLLAQAPAISYSTPQACTVGVAITPLLPANKGGAVGGLGFSPTATTVSTGLSDATCMATDNSGNMYIGESSGKVSMLAAGSRSATVFASGFPSVAGIAVDASHNVYVADGAFVWKIAAAGNAKSKLGSFRQPVGVALDAAGNIYVADPSGSGLGGVFKMAANGIAQVKIDTRQATTIAPDLNGNLFFTSGGSVFELPAGGKEKPLPLFLNAMAVATDPSGNVYAAYGTGGPIAFSMLPASGGLQTALKPIIAGLNARVSLMVDANFNLYAASGDIIKMNATGGYFISPDLPPGLTLNPTNGAISGTASAISPATNYTVKAFNAAGSSTATINIRLLNNDADLSQINAGIDPLTPAFLPDATSYSLNVSYATASITIRPVSRDPEAKVTLNGTPITSGTTSGPIALTEGGKKVITLVVTAPDRVTTKTYTLTVNRAQANNASLDAVSTGQLSPEVAVNTTNYNIPLADDGIKVHQAISPNGDGINDFLQIDNISQYPDNKLTIINRSGQLIYEASGIKSFDCIIGSGGAPGVGVHCSADNAAGRVYRKPLR